MMKQLIIIISLVIFTHSQANCQIALDSEIKSQLHGNPKVLTIEYEKSYFKNELVESEGWVFKTFYYPITSSIVRPDTVKTRIGAWKFYRKNGNLEYIDKVPVFSDSALRVSEHFNRSGKLYAYMSALYSEEIKSKNLNYNDYGDSKPDKYFYRTFYPNGQTKYESFEHKKLPIGQSKYYYENGQLSKLVNYSEKSARHGEFKKWHQNGNLKVIKEFKEGKKTGVWKFYDAEGNLIKEKSYNP